MRNVAIDAGIDGGLQRGIVVLPKAKPLPKIREEFAIGILIDAGFTKIGTWVADTVGGIALSTPAPKEGGVYVFVVDGLIKYIGLTRSGFHSRMANYRAGQAGQKTSARVNQIISDYVNSGAIVVAIVEIYIATPPAIEWNGLPVVTAAGLARELVTVFVLALFL